MKRLFLISLSAITFVSFSWEIQQRPSCSKPYKPYEFTSRDELDGFLDEVKTYKECINEFIEEQNQDIKTHQKAINAAVDEWEDFVRQIN